MAEEYIYKEDNALDDFPNMDELERVHVKKGRKIYLEETETELVFYFNPYDYNVTEEAARDKIGKIITSGGASGSNLDRLKTGEIRVYFNPLFHDYQSRNIAVEQMMYFIRNTAVRKDVKE